MHRARRLARITRDGAIICFTTVYIGLFERLVQTFVCVDTDSSKYPSVLRADEDMTCYTSLHVLLMMVSGLLLIILSLFPFFLLYKALQLRSTQFQRRAKYNAFFSVYKSGSMMFEPIFMLHRLFVVVWTVQEASSLRSGILIPVHALYFVAVFYYYPFLDKHIVVRGKKITEVPNRLELLSASLVLVCQCVDYTLHIWTNSHVYSVIAALCTWVCVCIFFTCVCFVAVYDFRKPYIDADWKLYGEELDAERVRLTEAMYVFARDPATYNYAEVCHMLVLLSVFVVIGFFLLRDSA